MTILSISTMPVSPLRHRLIDDTTTRRFSRQTQRRYIRDIGRLASFLGRTPDTASVEDLRRFQVALQKAGLGLATGRPSPSGLRQISMHRGPRRQGWRGR